MTDDACPPGASAARVIEAVAVQRELVARHLHDEAVQTVSVAALRVELVRAAVGAREEVDELRDALKLATTQIRAVMDSLRRPAVTGGELARSLGARLAGGDAPAAVVDELGDEPPEHIALALHWVVEECTRALRRPGGASIRVVLRSEGDAYAADVTATSADGTPLIADAPPGAVRIAEMVGGTVVCDASAADVTRLGVRIPR